MLCYNSRWNDVEIVLDSPNYQRMPCIVAASTPCNNVCPFGQDINQLAFAFIAPLCLEEKKETCGKKNCQLMVLFSAFWTADADGSVGPRKRTKSPAQHAPISQEHVLFGFFFPLYCVSLKSVPGFFVTIICHQTMEAHEKVPRTSRNQSPCHDPFAPTALQSVPCSFSQDGKKCATKKNGRAH